MCGVIERTIIEAESRSPLMGRTRRKRQPGHEDLIRRRIAREAAEHQGLDPQLMLDLDSSFH